MSPTREMRAAANGVSGVRCVPSRPFSRASGVNSEVALDLGFLSFGNAEVFLFFSPTFHWTLENKSARHRDTEQLKKIRPLRAAESLLSSPYFSHCLIEAF